MDSISKIGKSSLAAPIITIVIGIIFIVNPMFPATSVAIVLGSLTILFGVINGVIFAAQLKPDVKPPTINLVLAIIMVVIGIFTLTHTQTLLDIISYTISIYVLVDGVKHVDYALNLKYNKAGGWELNIFFALALVTVGVLTLFLKDMLRGVLGTVLGVILIIAGTIGMITVLRLTRIESKKQKETSLDVVN
ncbi:MAG: DUF308 domain-containing protein [Lachnospiraceae bacterium]|nr:DUF308 domain-containing protein [Candidatus Merdinaster equi]